MSNILWKSFLVSMVFLLILVTLTGSLLCLSPDLAAAASYDGSITQKILILVHGSAGAAGELSLVKETLETWGYAVEVFAHAEYYDLSGSGDHWYLHDQGGGHGDLDLVVGGNMRFGVIIFDTGDGWAYTDIETSSRATRQMFEEYPFLGIARMEVGCTSDGTMDNLFQISTSGSVAKSLTVSNPVAIWALEPLVGYQRSGTFRNISGKTSDVTALESYDDDTPALTLASYASGARAIYFGFKDWGHDPSLSMLVRLIQQYSGIPYVKPYYSFEVDDCGGSEIANADYLSLFNWTESNLGGYPTLALMETFLDPDPPADIMKWGLDPSHYSNNTSFNPNNVALMAALKSYEDHVVASHGYQHDADWWQWTATGMPVDPYADQDGDGIQNWQDYTIEGGSLLNHDNPNLTSWSTGAFVEPDLEMQVRWLERMREVLDLYEYSDSHVLILPKYEYLDGYTQNLASEQGFYVLSGRASNEGFTMTLGWVDGTFAPGRVSPSGVGTDADVALTAAQMDVYSSNFMGYVGRRPLCLVTNHVWQFAAGDTPGVYELRDSYLSGYGVMTEAGFTLVSTQAAANKNIGWLWTDMSSVRNSDGSTSLTLNSQPFQDGAARHELDIVMPYSIRQVKVGSNYCIYVDGNELFYGKQSNTSEALQVLSGTYDTSLPRISGVSTPATDVLNAIYDPTKGKISLMLDGTFTTTLNINDFSKPFLQGTTSIGSNGDSALTIGLAGVTSTDSVNMGIIPSSGFVDVAVQNWSTSGDYLRQWTESSTVPAMTTSHTIGDLTPNESYAIWYTKDGGSETYWQTLQANGSGLISFNYDIGYSTVQFEARVAPRQPSNVSPASGAVGVTVTPSLHSSAFSDPNPADAHAASQWQITTTSGEYDGPSLVHDSGVDTSHLIESVPLSLEYSTDYYWRVRHCDDNGAWSKWSTETHFTTGSATGSPPSKPVNSSPAGGDTGVILMPTLESSVYSDSDNHTHAASRWQLTTSSGTYSAPVLDQVDTDAPLTQYTLMENLGYSTTYYWHVRYGDSSGAWSSWSDETSFTTIPDPNHVPNKPVNSSPNNGASGVSQTPTLASAGFSDPDSGDNHAASQWRVTTAPGNYNYPYIVYDSGTDATNRVSLFIPSGMLNYSTVYYWHVRYQDNHGAWSQYSTEWSFTTTAPPNQVPNQPVNSSPGNGTTGVSLTPILLSSAFSDPNAGDTHEASQWQIRMSVGNYSSPLFDSGEDDENLTRIDVPSGWLNYSTTYYWRVRHRDNRGAWSDYSTECSFTTTAVPNQTPDQPVNSSPGNGAIDVIRTPFLLSSSFSDPNAEDAHEASQWQIRTSAGAYDTNQVYDSGADYEHLTQITAPSLGYSTTYYWHVRYRDNHGAWSAWSTETSFTTVAPPNQAPNQPADSSPANGATEQPPTLTLAASAFDDPDAGDTHAASQWQIRTNGGTYSSPAYDSGEDGPPLTSIAAASLGYSTTYYWHVRYRDNHGAWSDYSVEWSFTTRADPSQPPNQPVNSSPANGAPEQPPTLTLAASAFDDPDAGDTHAASQWQIRTNGGTYSSPVYDSGEDGPPLTSIAAPSLGYSTTYYWHVRYRDNHGAWSAWSTETSFTASTMPLTVTTSAASSLAATSATLNGNVGSLGTATSVTVSFQWGTTTSYGSETSAQSVSAIGAFSANLTGLTANTTFHFRAKAVYHGSAVYGEDMTFTASELADTTAPVSSVVNSTDITKTGATMTWSTNEAATSQVEYGLTEEYGSSTTLDTNLVTSHSVDLTRLKAGKTYHYRVISKDAAGNQAVSADGTFTTASRSGGMPVWVWVMIALAVVAVLGAAALIVRGRPGQ